ncbi:MAG TPA: FHA domain-containing protein [Gemmataceae bacterium]|jgi:pSer/pThr/pTyr-binding forkhead associated (FHA) protein|nr:FHA domain-containing protein [Gemmataceae bacterium]
MTLKFRLIEPGDGGKPAREIVLNQTDFLIGRGTDCDLRLNESTISRHHCILHQTAAEASLIDLGSSNGTFLNGQRVRSQAVLHSGDKLDMGSYRFVVVLGDQDWVEPGKGPGVNPAAATQKMREKPKS